MKKINLIEWLSRNSHEKQSPQRFARYAAMLIMLLTLGVGQMWADKDVFFYWTSIPSWYTDIWKVQYWDGSSDQYVSISSTGITDYYKATIGDNATGWRICRKNNNGRYNDGQWCDISTNGYNFFKVTGTASKQSEADNGDGPYGDKATIIGVVDGGGEIYFDNINTRWEGNIYFIIGRDNNPMSTSDAKWSNVFKMSQVCGTDLWKVSVSDDWKDADYYAVVCTGEGTWGNGAWGTSNLTNASGGYTAAYTSAQSLYDSKYYLLTPASGSNGTSFTIAEYASESALKKVFYPRYITVSASLDPSTITPSTNTNVTFSLTTNVPTSESPSFYFQMANWGAANSGAAGAYNMDGDHAMSSTSNPSQTVSNVNLSAGTYKSKVKITWDGATIVESDLLTLTAVYPDRTLAYNDNGKTGGGAAPTGGSYAHNSVQTVAGNINTMTKDNYTFAGWNTNATISGTAYAASSSITMNQDYTLYAKWTQTITLHANTNHHGTGDNSSATAVWNKASLEGFSATSGASGYTLDGYYTAETSGTKILNADGSFADDNISGYTTSGKWSHTGSAPTLYAHWVADTWDLYSNETKLGTFANTSDDHYRLNLNITNYNQAQWHFRQNNSTYYYTGAVNPLNENATLVSGSGMIAWQGGSTGHYTLEVFKSSSTWYLRAYASPQVNYTAAPTGGTVEASSNHDGDINAGDYVMYGSDVTFTATPASHYTLEGWYSASDFSGDNLGTTNPLPVSNVTSNTARYAKFALEQYTITLDIDESHHGTIDGKTTSQVVDYRGATTTVPYLPTGADGYKFMGFYTETGGGGTKLINADGTWIASVDDYTDGSKNWIHDADATLFAYYQAATITSLALPEGSVYTVGGSAFTATATVSAFDGNALVCWQVKNSREEEVSTTFTPASGNSVTVSIPATPGSYKVVASLKAGTTCSGDVLHTAQQSFTVQGNYTVSITGGTGSANVGEETTATVTADAATAGMKFDHWNVTGTISYTSGDVNSRTITFNASSDISLTAVYVARTTKKVYFAKPSGWSNVYAYAWQASSKEGDADPTNRNAAWHGVDISSYTETVKGTTYYYYQYYTDNNGEGDDKSAQNSWDKIVFNDNGSNKTSDLTIADGHFYHKADGQGENGRNTATISGSASAEDWYVCGYWNQSTNDWGFAHPVDLNGTTSGSVVVTVTASRTQEFKIYRASTDQWFKWTGGPSADYYDNYAALIGDPMTLRIYDLNRNTFTSYATEYLFTLDITSTSNPVLTVVPNENTPYSATLSKNGHGSLSVGTGAITLKQYIPTTITATPEPGYRFTGWTTTGSVAYAGGTSSSSATASFTATDNGGTITANFSNSNIIYFDRSAVNGVWAGSDVYVTFFTNNEHWEQYNDATHGAGQRVKMTNYVSTLHNLKMNRIPNTNIYYLNTNGAATQWYMFTDKNMPSDNETTWNQAAVARGDFNSGSGCNLFVVENYVEKTVAKTGYYYGYWMKYHEEDPGVQLCIYSSGSSDHISGSPFTLTTDEIGSTEFTESVHLSAATTYAIELKGLNGIYYKNRGTMTSKGSSGWEYVEREATRGYITTTAEGDYKFTLSCANQLILSAEYPLDVNDFQIVFNGKVKTTDGSNKIHPSRVIRHLTEAGTQKDTISFFVIKDNDWSLQIQKCSQVNPEITWENVGSAISPAAFGNPATGVYNFVVEQTHDGSSNSVLINTKVEKYDGHFYIRSDASKGGWEGYKKALDNQMIYSNFSRLNSDFDYYHCSYRYSGNNVKFTIANDYSSCVSDTTENDAYVTSYGNLPADASVRFMWNSETNVLSRAYLNGSHTTDFLLLEAKADSLKNFDGSAISGAGDFRNIKFKDMGNWIYQKEIQALPGTRVRLTSNYRFNSADHIQYFKGESGDWSETGANTEQIIGGTTTGWEKLRLVYDFKTNHLTSAWLPPTDPIDEAKSINADMLLIRRGQNAAQQLTFGVDGKIANVKTIVGAMEFVKDSIVGRVSHFNGDVIGAGGNRANRELMHYISFPFDVAVNDIYGFGQLNKEWYLQYYDGAERASKGFFRGDGTTTFWKYMTLADTLRANVGYSLLLDNDYFNTTGEGTVWHNTISDSIYLYFPSAKELSADSVIKTGTKTIRVPEHKHTSGRTFEVDSRTLCHDFTDSDWNMMGVPLFQNQTGLEAHFGYVADPIGWPLDGKGYFYEWDSLRNNFEIHTAVGYTFKSMHGYMVQYSGSVSFTGASIQPASPVVARRAPKSGENYLLELQLLKDSKRVSRTYVELREEACDTFALDEDVYMVYTSHPADLYTYAGNYDVSANVLSMDNHSIPVGIEVHQAGEYTFTMPSSFNGAATLIDTQTGARTNLALGDYTVSLPKGVCDGRFFIELDLNKMPTAIDGVTDGSGSLRDGNAHKFIENGIMYILRDGILYDARGNKVK